MQNKSFSLVICIVLTLGMFVSPVYSQEEPKNVAEEDTFTLASPWAPDSIDPLTSGSILLRIGILEGLVKVGYEGEIQPSLAQSWEISKDKTVWTFHLRDEVKFHDQSLLTAGDVAFSLRRAFDQDPQLSTLPVKEITAVNEKTVQVLTEKTFAPLLGYLAGGEAAIITPDSLDEKGNFITPIGTGPFKLEGWRPNESITAFNFEDYWGETAKMTKLTYLGIPEAKTRINMLRSGQVDMARLLPKHSAASLERDEETLVHTQVRMGRVNQLMLDTSNPLFSDVRVRKAVAYALDNSSIAESILEGIDRPAVGPFSRDMKWANEELTEYGFDPEKASELLHDAGWKNLNGDGIRKKDDQEAKVTLATYGSRAHLPPMAQVVKSYLENVGIEVNIRVLDWSAMSSRAKKGQLDMYLMSRATYWNNDPDSWIRDFHPNSAYQRYTGFSSTEITDMMEKAAQTMDTSARKEIYDKLQRKIMRAVPVVYLTYHTNVIAVSSDVRGYTPHPTEHCFHLENVWKTE